MGKEELDTAIGALESWGRTVDNWVLLCAAGVAISLAVEVVFSVAHWRNENRLRPLRTEQARLHDVEIEELRSANLKLEAQIQPRRLLPDQRQALVAAFTSFPDRSVSVWSYAREPEAAILTDQIIDALHAAKAPVIDRRGAMISTTVAIVGIQLTGSDDELIAAVAAALKGLSPFRQPYTPQAGQEAPAVEIFVGVKPIAH